MELDENLSYDEKVTLLEKKLKADLIKDIIILDEKINEYKKAVDEKQVASAYLDAIVSKVQLCHERDKVSELEEERDKLLKEIEEYKNIISETSFESKSLKEIFYERHPIIVDLSIKLLISAVLAGILTYLFYLIKH